MADITAGETLINVNPGGGSGGVGGGTKQPQYELMRENNCKTFGKTFSFPFIT